VFFYIYVFKKTLKLKYKKLFNFVSDIEEEFPDVAWIYKWFSTIFLYTFPNELVIIFWDYIFSESLVNSIKIAISILRFFEKDIL
jgi:hypothetical protein